ncbi:epoxide hydrolase [Luteibacter pinisoli]|uniref:Epoxide hydrolase n=1 Tax=Luteibacter pinisoli TaxID=2589080 RepID=A0A4Y5YXN5_9GAMM|nr:epoxide hydrolase family protein [Luteibacter pinisoli]QDE37740.1 epoxide hydrolase [Luteibacter pinisoli]
MSTRFQIPIDPRGVATLMDRLADTRWADAVVDDWSQGTERRFLEDLVRFWRTDYDWSERVRSLNRLPHFKAQIGGCGIHYLHFRSGREGAVPLMLLNGWPSSFIEYGKIVPILMAGAIPFDIVIPTMPGFGFSDRPHQPYEFEYASLFPELMTSLGYGRFAVAGTDIGSGTATRIAIAHPDRVLALHVSTVAPKPRGGRAPTQAESDYDARVAVWQRDEGGYQALQSSRPQTLAFALADSPVGLASWIVEKFRAWSDCDGDVLSVWPTETLLDTIMIYWTTNTIGSSIRYYFDAARLRPPLRVSDYVSAPTAVAMWPRDLVLAPRELAEELYNVKRYTLMARGGHFPAWEAADLYAEDLGAMAKLVTS